MLHFLRYMIQLLLSPAHGWEDIAAADTPTGELASRGFYPLTALTAVTAFLQLLYSSSATLPHVLVTAIVTFVMYFVGYFVAVFVMSVFLEPLLEDGYDSRRVHTFSLYSMALLEIVGLLQNCSPVPLAIAVFVPVYIVIIMFKGYRYMHVGEHCRGRFVALCIAGMILPPFLMQFLFNLIIPS